MASPYACMNSVYCPVLQYSTGQAVRPPIRAGSATAACQQTLKSRPGDSIMPKTDRRPSRMLACLKQSPAKPQTARARRSRHSNDWERPMSGNQTLPLAQCTHPPERVHGCQRVADEGVGQDVTRQLAQLLRQQAPPKRGRMQQAVRVELCPVATHLNRQTDSATHTQISSAKLSFVGAGGYLGF